MGTLTVNFVNICVRADILKRRVSKLQFENWKKLPTYVGSYRVRELKWEFFEFFSFCHLTFFWVNISKKFKNKV
jgi:hypothetical protein